MPDGTLARTHSVGVVTQITATLRLPSTSLPRLRSAQVRASRSGWSGQYGLLDYSCKPSPFRAGLLTNLIYLRLNGNQSHDIAVCSQCICRSATN
jgi:hypothetical protein